MGENAQLTEPNRSLVPVPAPAPTPERGSLAEVETLAKHLVRCGYFKEMRDVSQAVIKILAGKELGFQAVAAMTGINVIQGKISLGANLIAALIRRSKSYDYRIKKHTDTECVIEFFQNKESLGTEKFSLDDAKRANLLGSDAWKKYPKNMLFARCISNGAKYHAPDLFGGSPIYSNEELEDAGIREQVPAPMPVPSEVVTVDTNKVSPETDVKIDQIYQLMKQAKVSESFLTDNLGTSFENLHNHTPHELDRIIIFLKKRIELQ